MKKVEQVILGALLHDIGKFSQRAGVPNKFLKDDYEIARVCKKNAQGVYGYYHSLYTSLFLEENKQYFPIVTEKFEKPEDNFINFASCHHNPRTEIGNIITVADMLSSGMDRDGRKDSDTFEDQEKINFRKERLISLFSELKLKPETKNFPYKYHIDRLKYGEEMFPFAEEQKEELTGEYRRNWEFFETEFKTLYKENSNHFLSGLISLLEKYTWCIPSSTIDLPDISLFDHSITTASIAAALYEYHEGVNDFSEKSVNNKKDEKFILLSGDLSGIQRYIYNIFGSSSSGASKVLRSRSFYLELLNEASARLFVDNLGLNPVNILYCTGGKFLMLLPNLSPIKEKIKLTNRFLSEWFIKKFTGELSLNVTFIDLSGNDFEISRFSKKYGELVRLVDIKKKKKFDDVILQENSNFFVMDYDYDKYENGACRFCGKEPASLNIEIKDEDDEGLGEFCYEMKNFGEKIPLINKIGLTNNLIKNTKYSIKPLSFFDDKYYFFFLKENEDFDFDDFLNIYTTENVLRDKNYLPLKNISNYIPKKEYIPLSFEEIAENSSISPELDVIKKSLQKLKGENQNYVLDSFFDNSLKKNDKDEMDGKDEDKLGQKMLGVLRADVDNMGLIFGFGFLNEELNDSKLTISRYYALSRMFNNFFIAYLKKLIKENLIYNSIYTVYSGGDDLFLIGPWDVILDFSFKLNEKFRLFVGENKDITISAAIGLFKPSYPIKRFASVTGNLLEIAKEPEKKDKIKKDMHGNRLNLFNMAVSWEKAHELIMEGVFLENELRKNKRDSTSKINSSFVYRLLTYYRMYKEYKDKGKIKLLKYKPMLSYDISRNIVLEGDNGKIENEFEVSKIFEIAEKDMDNMLIPLSWAIYRTRKQNNKKTGS